MKLATLAALAAILLATVPQAFATEAHLERINLDPADNMYVPADAGKTISTDQREPESLEFDLRDATVSE